MKCHNCGASLNFRQFMTKVFPTHLKEYNLDLFKNRNSNNFVIEMPEIEVKPEIIIPVEQKPVTSLDTFVSELFPDHPAVKYVESRQIPKKSWSRIIYTDNFNSWVQSKTDKYRERKLAADKRILLPLIVDGVIIGVAGRALDPNAKQRYITIKFDDTALKIFGLEAVNRSLPILVVEGPIDALFLPNCVAICGGDVSQGFSDKIGKDAIFIFDNEPRSKDTINRMKTAISLGHRVAFWDAKFSSCKDINDLAKTGMSEKEICKSFLGNTFSGSRALIKLTEWKKV